MASPTDTAGPPKTSPGVVDGHLDVSQVPDHLAEIVERNASESLLLRLPGELRNKIWGYVADLVVIVHNGRHTSWILPCTATDSVTKKAFQLPRVCRQLYSDTRLLLFAQARFVVISKNTFTWCRQRGLSGKIRSFILSRAQVDAITTIVPAWRWDIRLVIPLFPGVTHMELWENLPRGSVDLEGAAHVKIRWHKGWAEFPLKAMVDWTPVPIIMPWSDRCFEEYGAIKDEALW